MVKTSNSDKEVKKSFPATSSEMVENSEKMLFGAAHLQGMLLRSVLSYNLEAVRFMHDRLKSDLATAETIASCKSFSELNDVGSEFFQRAVEEYSEEATTLANMAAGLANQTNEAMQNEVKEITTA